MARNQGATEFCGDRVDASALITMIVCMAFGAAFWAALFVLLATIRG